MDAFTAWALIRTVCAILCAICAIGTFVGSLYYWRKRLSRDNEKEKLT